MRIAMMGDNCIDIYADINRQYPTGNVVDTGVNLKKMGADVSLISTTGNDENGRWMMAVLEKEGLDLSHLKVGEGQTAVTMMTMDGLDRVHGDYIEGVLETMVFDEADIAFAATHKLVHTALWGKAEAALPALKSKGVNISFDYADRLAHDLVEQTLPFVDYGFYSYPNGRDATIEAFLKDKVKRGMKLAIATFGAGGSLAWDGSNFYTCGIVPVTVVNTVGAGDAFIAGVLYGILYGWPIGNALQKGAETASEVIGVFEPWRTT